MPWVIDSAVAPSSRTHFRIRSLMTSLDDRDEAMRGDACGFCELLIDVRLDAGGIGEVDDAAHLGAEHALRDRAFAQIVEAGIGLHQMDAVCFVLEPLVDLQTRHDDAPPTHRRTRPGRKSRV